MCDLEQQEDVSKKRLWGKKGAQQIIRCKKCAYHSPDKEAYLLKGRVCEPFAHAWNCYVKHVVRNSQDMAVHIDGRRYDNLQQG